MPQMMPINWMMSFIFFICSFLMFISMNYYINISFNNKKNIKNNFKKIMFNWKW